jgi:DNA-binding CsgD family transcriptional regulator/tetratricopeptide (TPR) repeat protein
VASAQIASLVGREEEQARLLKFVRELAEGPCALAIRGEAGIGKTVLWRAAVEQAGEAGVDVRRTRCVEAELSLPLGAIGDLVDTGVFELADELPRPQLEALAAAAGLMKAPAEPRPDRLALPRAFTSYLGALARRSPVLVAIDDVHWLDSASERVLAFAVRRLGSARVGILVTQRAAESDPLDLVHALDRFEEMCLGPLSIGALHHLVRVRLGAQIGRPTLARIHAASGGNPMFALEFARIVAARGAAAGGPLPIPPSLETLMNERVAAFPLQVRSLFAIVAAVERPTPPLLEAALDGAGVLLDEAFEEGAIAVDENGVVRFAHPLLASAAYAAVPPVRRRRLHARLARLTEDPAERARHLALSSIAPSRDVAAALDEAATHLRARGAPDAAAELARHAIRLTPADERADREERTLAVAEYLVEAGQLAASVAVVDELLAHPHFSGPRRARALWLRALTEMDGEATWRLAEEACEHVGDDRVLAVRLLLYRSVGADMRDPTAGEELGRRALAAAEELGEPGLLAAALSAVARRAAIQGRPQPMLVEEAVRLADAHGEPRWSSLATAIGQQRLWSGDLDGARALLENELEALHSRGIYFGRKQLLRDLVDLEWRAGNWEQAERHLDDHWQLTFDGGDEFHEFVAQWQQGLLATSRGRIEEADRLTREAVAHAAACHWPLVEIPARWTRGFLALSLNEPQEAVDALAGLPTTLERLQIREPGIWPILPDAIEARVAVGQLEQARRLLATFDAQARALNHRWAKPAALRCRALLLLADGETGAAVAAADDAATRFEALGFKLDHGRALLLAGDALRRRGERRRAADRLESAADTFSTLGAPLWLARVERELKRARPRPQRHQELTSAERRVAELVAAGSTNREVAAQLFTTVGTVEVHLTRIYRKIGVRSRTELARRVGEGRLEVGG